MGDITKEFINQLQGSILDQLTGRVYLRDWQHAAKTFIPGNFGNAGKVKFTFHTYFSINEQAYQPPTGQNYGLLVKSIKLPTFNMEVQELNQYNRKRLIQSKIKYQPIDITFHDDNSSQVTAIWDAYYRYNYADAWNPVVNPWQGASKGSPGAFNRRNIYDPSISGDTEYGYRGDARGPGGDRADGGEKIPFFNNITVYGLWAGQFISYTLINPIITSMDHDTYDYADGGGTMQNRMTIDYETVVYNTGTINEGEEGSLVPGFQAPANYDGRQSPLEQGGNSPADLLARMQRLGSDDTGILEKIRIVGDTYAAGSDAIRIALDKQIKAGLQEAVLGALGLGGDTNFPTDSSSPAMINIANQGVVTGANNTTAVPAASEPKTAGQQVKGLIRGVLGI